MVVTGVTSVLSLTETPDPQRNRLNWNVRARLFFLEENLFFSIIIFALYDKVYLAEKPLKININQILNTL